MASWTRVETDRLGLGTLHYHNYTENVSSSIGIQRNYKGLKKKKMHACTVELLQIVKDDAVKVLHSLWQQIWKTHQWSQDWKWSVFIIIPKKGNAKEGSNYHTIVLISHASKVMLKILQVGLQKYMN